MIKQNHRFIAKGILSIHKYHPFGGTRYHVNLIHRQNLDMGPNLGQKAICRIEGDILFPPIPCSKIVFARDNPIICHMVGNETKLETVVDPFFVDFDLAGFFQNNSSHTMLGFRFYPSST